MQVVFEANKGLDELTTASMCCRPRAPPTAACCPSAHLRLAQRSAQSAIAFANPPERLAVACRMGRLAAALLLLAVGASAQLVIEDAQRQVGAPLDAAVLP